MFLQGRRAQSNSAVLPVLARLRLQTLGKSVANSYQSVSR